MADETPVDDISQLTATAVLETAKTLTLILQLATAGTTRPAHDGVAILVATLGMWHYMYGEKDYTSEQHWNDLQKTEAVRKMFQFVFDYMTKNAAEIENMPDVNSTTMGDG